MKPFSKHMNGGFATIGLAGLVGSLTKELQSTGGKSFASDEVARGAMSLESIDGPLASQLESSFGNLTNTLERIMSAAGAHTLGLESMSDVAKYAGASAGVMAGDIQQFMRTKAPALASTDTTRYIGAVGAVDRMQAALEAYDEKENRNAPVYSVAYNMQAARQDEFGETLYPTVVVTPDQVGFQVSIHLVMVYEEVRRKVSGALDQFKRRNIIQAVRDPSILRNDSTKIVPVHQAASAAMFVPAADLAPRNVQLDGAAVTTSALAFGKKFSLLGISQTDALLETGLLDSTDAIDPAIDLDAVYLNVVKPAAGSDPAVSEMIRLATRNVPTANFVYSPQGDFRLMTLNFTSTGLKINDKTKKADGTASTLLAPIVSGDYEVRLSVQASGSVNLQLADTNLFAGDVTVVDVKAADGTVYQPTDSTVAALVALFVGAKLVGYDLDARRTNTNRRQRGQLLDTTVHHQIYAVPLLSPITIPRPLGLGDQTDTSDLAALITATRIRTSAAAVDEVLRTADLLRAYVSGNEAVGDTPEILGVARFLVTPYFKEVALDVNAVANTLTSNEKLADARATILNVIRDMVYRAYRDSGYKAAADALAGGQAAVPTVILATDQVIAGYLWQEGDTRTLGNGFQLKVVDTQNIRMKDKIVITFGQFGGNTEGVPNPMHFGNMAWKPEMTVVLPLHRNGGNSKELTVQPSFRHITNLPVMGLVTVTGLEEIMNEKTAINNHPIP